MSVPKKIQEKYEKLKNEIILYSKKYYDENNPIISDNEYDKLFNELIEMEKNFPELKKEDSPSLRVGGTVSQGFEKVTHSFPMLSLDNTYNDDEIREFDARIVKNLSSKPEYYSELKIDGVSISLIYEKGYLKSALTRGNGITGENVINNIRTVKSIPLKISEPIDIIVRGEIYMPVEEFKKINEKRDSEGLNIFANPRNSTAGSLKLLDSSEVARRNLDSFIYYVIEPQNYGINNQEQAIKFLSDLGFKVNSDSKLCADIDEVIEYWKYWNEERKNISYDVDGIVVKVNDFSQQRDLGETVRSPRWAISYKFEAERKKTKIEKIVLQVGSTGIITPVAEFEPVFLEGTTVKRASLHNFDYMSERDIKENDIVFVEKAGGIIPQVVSVSFDDRKGDEKNINVPEKCPVCGGEVGKTNPEEVAYRCLNPFCKAKLKGTLQNFVSREGMNIEGLGEKMIERFVESGLVENISDIYGLNSFKIATLGHGIGIKTITNILQQIENSKKAGLDKLLNALGIPLVGKKTAKLLAEKFGNMDNLIQASTGELTDVEGIGEDIAKSVKEYFKNKDTIEIIDNLKNYGLDFTYKNNDFNGPLKGVVISQTGELSAMSRKEFENYVVKLGGIFTNNVTKKTKILVLGDKPGSKLEKAKSYGISIMEENEFFSIYKED